MMERQAYGSDISREQFEPIRSMLETARRRTRPRKHDLYDVYCAVLYFLDQGIAWRNLPPGFPPWRTVHEYFTQWTLGPIGKPTLLEQTLELVGRQGALQRLRQLLGKP